MCVPARTQEVWTTASETRLVINPHTDHEFGRRAHELAEHADGPEQLQALLRDEYTRAGVVRGVTDVTERWYVYREGHWVNAPGP